MTMPSHLVSAKIAEARARGALEQPTTDEARLLCRMDRLLGELHDTRGARALAVREQLRQCERVLADVLERTGQTVLADALWDENPVFEL